MKHYNTFSIFPPPTGIKILYPLVIVFSSLSSDFRKEMVNYIPCRLNQSSEISEEVNTRPSKKVILGQLALRKDSYNYLETDREWNSEKASIGATHLRASGV